MLQRLLFFCLVAPIMTALVQAKELDQVVESGGYSVKLGPLPQWVRPNELRTTWPEDAPGASGVATRVWMLDSQTDLRAGGTTRYFEYTHQVLSAQALAQSSQVQWSFEPNYQTLTVHAIDVIRNGKASTRIAPERITLTRRETDFERLMLDGMVTLLVVLPDVQVNDIIRVRVSVFGANPILEGVTSERFSLRTDAPTLDRRIRILADKDAQLSWHSSEAGVTLDPVEVSGYREWRHAGERLEAPRLEPDEPHWWTPFGELIVSDKRSWKDVARWALALYPKPSGQRLAEQVAHFRQLPDREQQVLAALRFVQDDIRYFGVEMGSSTHRPADPDVVLERRFGDCKDKARLLSAMLEALGLDAVPALVSAGRRRAILEHPANASSFDHVIVRLVFQGETYWLDPTLTLQRGALRQLGFPDYDVALPVSAETDGLVPMQPPPEYLNESVVEENFLPGEGAAMLLEVRTRYRGEWAESTRRELAGRAAVELQKQWTDYYARLLDGATARNGFQVEDNEATNELLITEQYLLPSLWRSAGATSSFVDLEAYAIGQRLNLNPSADRKSPLALYHPARFEQITRVTAPARSQLLIANESTQVDSDVFGYVRDLKVQDNTLRISHRIESKSDHVPFSRLPIHLAKLRDVRLAMSTRVSVEFDNPHATPRNERLRRVLDDLLKDTHEDRN